MIKARLKLKGGPVITWKDGKIYGSGYYLDLIRATVAAEGDRLHVAGFGSCPEPLTTWWGFEAILARTFPGGYTIIKDTEKREQYPDTAVF